MIALPLSILALAAGVYLLIKVNREYLGGLFKALAWLIIVLSLIATVATICHGVHHLRHMHGGFHHPEMHSDIMIKEMHSNGSDSVCMMSGCKMMGDSVILDRAICEKMMGKESCEKLCKERGQCIMTKDECAKMCGGTPNGNGGAMKSCCQGGADNMPACCQGGGVAQPACCQQTGKEPKACCKK